MKTSTTSFCNFSMHQDEDSAEADDSAVLKVKKAVMPSIKGDPKRRSITGPMNWNGIINYTRYKNLGLKVVKTWPWALSFL